MKRSVLYTGTQVQSSFFVNIYFRTPPQTLRAMIFPQYGHRGRRQRRRCGLRRPLGLVQILRIRRRRQHRHPTGHRFPLCTRHRGRRRGWHRQLRRRRGQQRRFSRLRRRMVGRIVRAVHRHKLRRLRRLRFHLYKRAPCRNPRFRHHWRQIPPHQYPAAVNASMLNGNASMVQPDGTNAIGRAGNGHARITLIVE